MEGKDFQQAKLDMDNELLQLGAEVADKVFEIMTKYQSGDMTGADVETMGVLTMNEFYMNFSGCFLDRCFELSDEVDGIEPITFEPDDEESSGFEDDVTEID
ncbi:hypothetical protein QB910_000110 [Dabrowskivirus KKP3916]|uniref:Uncharacterized protein n=1 Tax=Alicyclobacillus phage KKP_3916 TaxID=3040651 RepID=A0AAT9V7R0_9CAUD|nr:hypothetical protein QB910_000110 [Alicyclobacillus phage KKP 3916]